MNHQYGFFGSLGIDEDEDDYQDAMKGSAELIIKDEEFPLFITSEWKLTARVNDKYIAVTDPIDHPHSKDFIKRWSLSTIRTNKKQLKKLGVDVEKYYLSLGGKLFEL
jgi:hypothetical protein